MDPWGTPELIVPKVDQFEREFSISTLNTPASQVRSKQFYEVTTNAIRFKLVD
jgi:hypothetical protein